MSTLVLKSATGANSPVDGNVIKTSASSSWTDLRNAAGEAGYPSVDQQAYVYASCTADGSAWDYFLRSYFLFDPAGYTGDVADITGVKLYLKASLNGADAGSDQYISLVGATPTNDNNLVAGDYAIAKFGTTKYATDIKVVDVATGWISFTLNAAGVQLVKDQITGTDLVRLGIRLASDISGTEPSRGNDKTIYVYGYFADSVGNEPYLEITYSTATAYTMECTVGEFILTGINVNLLRPIRNMAVSVGEFALTGIDIGIGRTYNMAVSVGQFILIGIDVILKKVGWDNQSKHDASPTNLSKHNSSATNQSKNNSSVSNQSKS